MTKNLPLGTIAVGLLNSVLALMYGGAARAHPTDLWLVPVSLAFTAVALLAVAVGLKFRELSTRLTEVEHQLKRPA